MTSTHLTITGKRLAATAALGGALWAGALAPAPAQAADAAGHRHAAHASSAAAPRPSDTSSAAQGAIDWARSQLGLDEYDGYCLSFVHDAFADGGGIDIGSANSAVDYWNARPDLQHPGDTAPPAGALVFWNATSTNPYGHVGLSEGGDTVISSYEQSTHTIHEFSLAQRNGAGYPYLGWMVVG